MLALLKAVSIIISIYARTVTATVDKYSQSQTREFTDNGSGACVVVSTGIY